MAERQPFYKYIVASLFLATCLEFSRFFEFKLTPNNSMYITTCMAENPYYVQYNSYWNEIFATGLVPLILLCYMNLKIFQKIKVSAYLLSWMKKKENNQDFFSHFPTEKESWLFRNWIWYWLKLICSLECQMSYCSQFFGSSLQDKTGQTDFLCIP